MGADIFELKGNTALYNVLDIQQNATEKEIRRSYYRLAMVYHPDKNPDGETIFKEICFAYNILSDPEKRIMYDNQTLRNNLLDRAKKEYNPEMDPNVELSPEDLRKFVERLRMEQVLKEKNLNEFENRRATEMLRRSKYVPKHSGYESYYEASLKFGELSDTGRDRGDAKGNQEIVSNIARPFRTTAELLSGMQQEEEQRFHSFSARAPSSPSPTPQTAICAAKKQMINEYRISHDCAEYPSARIVTSVKKATSTSPGFVNEQESQLYYSETIDQTLKTFSDFDYRGFVERGMQNRSAIEGAILADALQQYDRYH
ncbi:unnamed protein product [Phytomonas sp. EM1]|nr:unnamed protein product [Phytomonas sp. EM1]|eukprot:CCW60338.1 unnamed protein product [Phytomonas sp. isolate EM1]